MGSQAGVAVLAPTTVAVTCPPGRSNPIIEEGRLVAGRVHYGVRGGFVLISVYMRDWEQLGPENIATLWRLVEFLHEMNSRGVDWVVCRDWNMDVHALDHACWITRVRGIALPPSTTTCRKSLPGSTIDYHLISMNVLTRVAPEVEVDEQATTHPHRPVQLVLLDRPRDV